MNKLLLKRLRAREPLLPTCAEYAVLLGLAAGLFGVSRQECREKFGLYDYAQWARILGL